MYTIKTEKLDELFIQNPEARNQMVKAAVKKRLRHSKKIKAIEKRYPVYGLINSASGGGKLRAVTSVEEAKGDAGLLSSARKDKSTNFDEMIQFLDDLDERLSLNELDFEKVKEI